MKLFPIRARPFVLIATFAAILLFLVLLLLRSSPGSSVLMILSSDSRFGIATTCTFDTNHVYYYGDSMDRILDPVVRRKSDINAYRLRHGTAHPSTLVWVRLEHPDFAKLPPLIATPTGPLRMPTAGAHRQFRARLVNEGATETVLDQAGSLQNYKGGYYVGGWLLSGSLENHRGGVLHIESTNGTEVVTFRIP